MNKLRAAANDWRVWVLFLVLQVPSLRALAKYTPDGAWLLPIVYLAAGWFLYADLLHDGWFARTLRRLSKGALLPVLLLIALFVIQAMVYPRADALKYEGRGTPQDDALVAGGEYLAHGLNPYEALTYRREYVSAGPGWIALALPFTLTGTIGFFNPVWIFVTVLVLWRALRSWQAPLLFLVLLMSSLAFWEMTVSGSDMISIGCALLLSVIAVFRYWSPYTIAESATLADGPDRRHGGAAMARFKLGISYLPQQLLTMFLLAFTATSRIVFAYAVPLIGGFLWRRNRRQGTVFLIAAGGLTVILHLVFYLWNPPAYFPLHRFSDTNFLPGIAWPLTAAVASVLMMLLAIQLAGESLAGWIFYFWLALTVAMFFSALGDLIAYSFKLARWEGANYLGVVVPIFAAWIALGWRTGTEPAR